MRRLDRVRSRRVERVHALSRIASSTGVVDIVDMTRDILNVLWRSIGAHALQEGLLEKVDSSGKKLRIRLRLQRSTYDKVVPCNKMKNPRVEQMHGWGVGDMSKDASASPM